MKLPAQEQAPTGTIEYEFDVAGLLNAGDTIASVDWDMPAALNLVNSVISGTKITGYIEATGSAELYKSYWVTFTVNSVGNPTSVSPELSFQISIVKRIRVEVI